MEKYPLKMKIEGQEQRCYRIRIKNKRESVIIKYDTDTKNIQFEENNNNLNAFLKERICQLSRILNNKRCEFQWVKSHHQSAENKLCDFHSKNAARDNNDL